MVEEWRPIVGYEGRYDVSNHGAVRSNRKKGDARKIDENGETTDLLKPIPHWRGYLRVALYSVDGTRKFKRIHSLVAEAFIGPRPAAHPTEGDYTVDHENEHKTDNVLTNLSWVTRIGNHRRHYERTRAAFIEIE